jgi:hypothetical protein
MASEADLITALLNAASVTAVCEESIFFDQWPQGPRSPYVVLSTVIGLPKNYLQTNPTMDSRRIQVDCYATSAQVARNLAVEVREVFETLGVMLSENPTQYDAQTKLFIRSLDFSFLMFR